MFIMRKWKTILRSLTAGLATSAVAIFGLSASATAEELQTDKKPDTSTADKKAADELIHPGYRPERPRSFPYQYRPHSLYGPYYREFPYWDGYYVPPHASPYGFWWNYGGNYEGAYRGYPYDALGFPF